MATATSKLKIIVDVINDPNASRSINSLKSGLSTIGIAVAGITTAALAAKQAWDFTKEGAELEKVAGQFRNVAENAGYMSDVLMNQMRTATSGMVSDAELMRSGLRIMELGLADSQEGVVRLATVVSTLGLDMQQVIMTFANNSELRLDSLGLSIDTVRQRVKELNAEGFEGDAFDQAVLEGLEERYRILGDASETTAGQMQMLEVSMQNAKDEAKRATAEAIGPLIIRLNDEGEATRLLTQAQDEGVITGEQYRKAYLAITLGIGDLNAVTEELTNLLQFQSSEAADADSILANYRNTIDSVSVSVLDSYTAFNQATSAEDFYARAAEEAGRASNVAGTAIRDAASAADSAATPLTILGQKYSEVSTNVWSVTQSLQDQINFLTAGGGALLQLAAVAKDALNAENFEGAQEALDAAALGAVDLDLELGKIDPDEAAQRLMDLGLGPEEAKAKVEELQSTLFTLTAQQYTIQFNLQTNGGTIPGSNISVPSSSSGNGDGTFDKGGNTGMSAGFGGGGAVVQILGPVTVVGDNSFMAWAAEQAMRAQRNAAGVNAGALYTGAA